MDKIRTLPWPVFLALFLGAVFAFYQRAGHSPRLWLDTLNDERLVNLCLEHGSCALAGAPVSFGHLWQGSTWHQLRAVFEYLGLGISGTHLVMLVLDALMVALVALAATKIAGLWAGLLGAFLTVVFVDSMDPFSTMLWNFRPLPFLGALVLALGLLLEENGKIAVAVAASAVAAISTNMHLVSGMIFLPLLFACLLVPQRRLVLLGVVSVTFFTWLLFTSPSAWWHNLTVIWGGDWLPVSGTDGGTSMFRPVVLSGLIGTAGLLAIYHWQDKATRRHLLFLVAFILPLLASFLGSQKSISMNRTDRYLAPIVPAMATGVAVTAGLVGSLLLQRFARLHLGSLNRRAASLARVVIPYAVALLLCLLPAPTVVWAGFPLPTFGEVQRVLEFLGKEQGWDRAKVFQGLKGPFDYLCLETMEVLGIDVAPAGSPNTERLNAYIFKVPTKNLPKPLPANTLSISSDGDSEVIVVLAPTWLDWHAFQVCTSPDLHIGEGINCHRTCLAAAEQKSHKPIFAIDEMPNVSADLDQTLILRIPVHLPPEPAYQDILMPRIRDQCGGRVFSVPEGPSWISRDGRQARLLANQAQGQAGELVLLWELGGPDCQPSSYNGFPPFFVEADPASMQVIAPLVATYEKVGT